MFKRLNLRSPGMYLLGFAGAVILAFLARTLWFYHSLPYTGPNVPESTLQAPSNLSNPYAAVSRIYSPGNLVVFDNGHDNGFTEEEMGLFAGRLASGGAQVEFVSDNLAARLHEATALVVAVPSTAFSRDEVIAVQQFVGKGGRLIILGDPTRVRGVEGLNSLAGEFGVVYLEDYIYNLEKNDGSFRNVIFTRFGKDNPLTDGLTSVVFETAHALRVAEDRGIILGDDNTFSSGSEKPGGVIAAALTGDGKVLSLPDMTFLTGPYNSFADNDHLIDNIVTFALSGQRQFALEDFPYFFGASTEVIYQDPAILDKSFDDFTALRDHMSQAQKTAALVKEIDSQKPYIYLATYDTISDDVKALLEKDGITIEGRDIQIKDVTTLNTGDTAFFHLIPPPEPSGSSTSAQATEGAPTETAPYRLIILADSKESLSSGVKTLLSDQIAECALSPVTALCQTKKTSGEGTPGPSGEGPTPSPGATTGDFLVIADDITAGSADLTSAPGVKSALSSQGHSVTLRSLTADGWPSAAELLKHNAVFWSSGGYAPTQDGIKLLKDYMDQGGNLFIDGGEIAFYWKDDPFLSDYLQAAYVSYGEQLDLQVGSNSHPLSQGFGGDVITLTSGAPPDIIDVKNADVVFVRGPGSVQPGKPALIAYQKDTRRLAFASFQVSLLDQNSLDQLISNAASWFLSK